MSSFYSRQHYKSVYGPLATKTLPNILKRELMEQFGFENMGLIADSLIKRFFEIVDEYSPNKSRLLPGQLLWLAVSVKEKVGYGKSMLKTKLVPVKLTLISPEEIQVMVDERKSFKELLPDIVARILKEAKSQGGVLALSDVALMLKISANKISQIVATYRQTHPEEVLPYRGTLHDMGPTVTHKVQAIELRLKGLLTQEIARRIGHDPTNVDAYTNNFERVFELYEKGESIERICFYTNLSQRLVAEYIEIIKDLKEKN